MPCTAIRAQIRSPFIIGGDYIDPYLIKEFERETGLKVIYQTFDSNEAMLTKIAHGGVTFDVVIPSDYAISKMKEQELLIPPWIILSFQT